MLRDEELVRDAQAGDSIALEQILRRYEARIYQVGLRLLRHHHDAEDVTQQTLTILAKCLKQYRSQARFSTWVMRIAHNQSLKTLRKRYQQPAHLFDDKKPDRWPMRWSRTIGWRSNPELLACQAEDRRLLEAALEKCDLKYRVVFQLRHWEGCSTRQVAEALQVKEETVKVRLHRVHALLREYLQRKHGSSISGWR